MAPEPIDPIAAWNDLVEMADDVEIARLEALSPAALQAELAKSGNEQRPEAKVTAPAAEGSSPEVAGGASGPEVAHTIDVVPPSTPENVVSLDARRASKARRIPTAYFVYAAVAAVLAAIAGRSLGLFGDPHAADHTKPDVSAPHDKPVPAPQGPSKPDPAKLAADARTRASLACATRDWDRCAAALDEAAESDPASEGLAEVVEMRKQVKEGQAERLKRPDKVPR